MKKLIKKIFVLLNLFLKIKLNNIILLNYSLIKLYYIFKRKLRNWIFKNIEKIMKWLIEISIYYKMLIYFLKKNLRSIRLHWQITKQKYTWFIYYGYRWRLVYSVKWLFYKRKVSERKGNIRKNFFNFFNRIYIFIVLFLESTFSIIEIYMNRINAKIRNFRIVFYLLKKVILNKWILINKRLINWMIKLMNIINLKKNWRNNYIISLNIIKRIKSKIYK